MGALARFVIAMIGTPYLPPAGLLRRFPELKAVRWRRGGLPPRVGGWALGTRTVAAITLWRTVFLSPDTPATAELLLHELGHVRQYGASRTFPVLYLLESLRHGYSRNRFEADARSWAAERLRLRGSSPPNEDA